MDIEDRLSIIEGRLNNIEFVLGMNPQGMKPLDSEAFTEIRDRLIDVEIAVHRHD